MTRVRFAPSPTGYLHVGGLRSALYNYLYAKSLNGKVILRVEDTDRSRFVEGAISNMVNSLKLCGIEFDEGPEIAGDKGPYTQSERTEIYRKYANILEEKGFAYKCFCTSEELEKRREEQVKNGQDPVYDRRCRSLSAEEVEKNIAEGKPYTVRLKVPMDGSTVTVKDMVYGDINVVSDTIDDQILMKNDGYPTYHLANVVDDHLMEISHVIRGQEWLPSTPKHVVLYNAFGWEAPVFAHLPLLVNKERKKLSKRHGDVSVESFIEKGYLPEALLNFVALLGWHPSGDREMFTLSELVEEFKFDRVNKSDAVFDYVKLEWMNSQYMAKADTDRLVELAKPFFEKAEIDITDTDKYKMVIDVLKSRVSLLSKFPEEAKMFYTDKFAYENAEAEELAKLETSTLVFSKFLEKVDELEEFNGETAKNLIFRTGNENKVKGKLLWMPFRIALTGQNHGPDLDKIIDIFGKEKVIERLKRAIG